VVFNHFFERNQVKKVVIANASMVLIFVSIVFGAYSQGLSASISGAFLLASIIPATTMILLSYKEHKADSPGEHS
jgi:hypothetical protein